MLSTATTIQTDEPNLPNEQLDIVTYEGSGAIPLVLS